MSTYDRFTTANYHGLRDGERSSECYGIPKREFFCCYKIKGQKKCGKPFTSTSPNAKYCDAHREAGKREYARRKRGAK
jgi:hypothetical protein